MVSLCAVVLASGCGSSGGSNQATAQSGPLTKAEFVAQANMVCKETQEKIFAKTAELSSLSGSIPRSEEKKLVAEVVRSFVIPTYEEEIKGIAALQPPRSDQPQITAYLQAIAQDVNTSRRRPIFAVETTYMQRATQLAEKYGLRVCAGLNV